VPTPRRSCAATPSDRKRHLSGAHCWRHHRHRPVHRRGHRAGFRELQAFLALIVASELDIAANRADWDREGWAQLVAGFAPAARRSASEPGAIITTTEPGSAKDLVPPPRSRRYIGSCLRDARRGRSIRSLRPGGSGLPRGAQPLGESTGLGPTSRPAPGSQQSPRARSRSGDRHIHPSVVRLGSSVSRRRRPVVRHVAGGEADRTPTKSPTARRPSRTPAVGLRNLRRGVALSHDPPRHRPRCLRSRVGSPAPTGRARLPARFLRWSQPSQLFVLFPRR
jgi:hypothetical protein